MQLGVVPTFARARAELIQSVRLILSPTPLNLGSSCHLSLWDSKGTCLPDVYIHLCESRYDTNKFNPTLFRSSRAWEVNNQQLLNTSRLA